ncbi:putative receptor-like protein kinase At3g47110 [Juglans regia]|uniref:non-specific serine/threonine protein kinase n=1 Tax=Juglans regia TaxID=51240 RepID=A0A6P9DY69_JUGRE|nr:putative receptor-like protein kinase At3g47110 [Juglans regia]
MELHNLKLSVLYAPPTASTVVFPTNESDRLALLKFKESITNDPRNILSSWNASSALHFCKWQGVSCGSKHQRVTALQLQGYSLRGSISPYVGNLSFLSSVNLRENFLGGEIPAEVTRLFRLKDLYLSNNSFTGEIPRNLTNCPELRVIDLERNKFTGRIPDELGSLKRLEMLVILSTADNRFDGTLPANIGLTLPNLQFLAMNRNKFSGPIPVSLSNSSQLVTLLLYRNNFVGQVPNLGNLLHLRNSEKKLTSIHSKSDILSRVSYKELYQVTGGFSPNNLIGSGGFGSVYRGILRHEERMVAVKILKLEQKGASKSFMAECNVLRTIRHRNLVKILTCCSSVDYSGNEFKAIIYEYMPNGSLEKWLHPDIDNGNQSRNLNLLQRLNAAIDVASALHYLHDHCETSIVHCDLKPSNVLLDDDMIAHVSDFGLARLLSPTNHLSHNQTSTTGIKGSVGYAAPEYGMGGEASTQGDVYSYGIFVLEMFTGQKPTDEMFEDSFNLHNFVKMALPEKLVRIVSPKLLTTKEVDEIAAAATNEDNYKYNDHDNDIEEEESQMNPNVQKCLLSVLQIGLACSLDSPKERMNMEDVTRQLHRIKNAFLGFGISG